jgi:hypothetical protein
LIYFLNISIHRFYILVLIFNNSLCIYLILFILLYFFHIILREIRIYKLFINANWLKFNINIIFLILILNLKYFNIININAFNNQTIIIIWVQRIWIILNLRGSQNLGIISINTWIYYRSKLPLTLNNYWIIILRIAFLSFDFQIPFSISVF